MHAELNQNQIFKNCVFSVIDYSTNIYINSKNLWLCIYRFHYIINMIRFLYTILLAIGHVIPYFNKGWISTYLFR